MIAWIVTESCIRIWFCCSGGKTSMTRSMVCGASVVCRVANTRWPVSAAVIARDMVSRSRISPTRITSGFCRITCFKRRGERVRVDLQLALVDLAHLVLVDELDRVLDGHHVAAAVAVDVIDHRRQRGGFARAGRARHQHQSARPHADVLGDLRQHQVVDRLDLDRNRPQHRAHVPALPEAVHAESRTAPRSRRTGRAPCNSANRCRRSSLRIGKR